MEGLLIDEDGDLMVRHGSLVVGECSADVAERVLRAYPGDFKEFPEIGLFASAQLNGRENPFWRGESKKQLRSCGVEVKIINTDNGIMTVEI
ncbi:MAG TPA: hypothetical protein PKW49_03275 [Paludibacteraceae bacterium]|nr:hypothetical protein [Paludibacteraceae bacterium]